MLKSPDVYLFDVMGTLVYDPFYAEVPAFFDMTLDELIAVKDPTAWLEFERGELDEATFLARFFADGRPFDGPGLKTCMAEAFRPLEGVEALLEELGATGRAVHALSNYAPWYSLIEERLRLSRWLEWSFVSCDTGVRKPDHEAYLGPARALGVEPSACLFVDDREENCAAARAVGMPALHFTSVAELRVQLGEAGSLS